MCSTNEDLVKQQEIFSSLFKTRKIREVGFCYTGICQQGLQIIKNLNILISKRFFFSLTLLWEAKQSISRNISFSLMIINLKVVLREFLHLVDLTRAHVFCIYESTKIVIVSKNKNLIFIIFQVVVPSLESLNNGYKFLIVSLVPSFYGDHFLRKKSY